MERLIYKFLEFACYPHPQAGCERTLALKNCIYHRLSLAGCTGVSSPPSLVNASLPQKPTEPKRMTFPRHIVN